MLHRHLLHTQLENLRGEIAKFERGIGEESRGFARRLGKMNLVGAEHLRDAMRRDCNQPLGAIPSSEFDESERMIRRFNETWRKHDEARAWAMKVLENRTTFAADGSQMLPGRDVSLPIAAVQIGMFENPHQRDATYIKNVNFEIVSPNEIAEADEDQMTVENVVTLKRFDMEAKAIEGFIARHTGWRERGERMPLAFLDGTLLPSFTKPRMKVRERYAETIKSLVTASEQNQVPVVGFIDESYARDLTVMLDYLIGVNHTRSRVCDAQILRAKIENDDARLASWGERSIFCYCLREGLGEEFCDDNHRPRVGFSYLQTIGDGTPARLDMPSWIHDAKLLDEVIDTVRAECVVGNGYPYAIETADQTAVLTMQDRALFLRTLDDEFAAHEDFDFTVSRKALSKAHRR